MNTETLVELIALLIVTAIEALVVSIAFPATFTYLQAFVVVYAFQALCNSIKV